MIKTVCDICHREVKQQPGLNFCERCAPHSKMFAEEVVKLIGDLDLERQRRLESFRNKFLKDVVLADRPKLEAVAGAK